MVTAAVVATVLLGIIAVFQLALAAGAPLGRAAWGGQHEGVLPTRLRIASAVAGLVIYPLIIAAVLSAGGVMGVWLGDAAQPVMWALAALFGVGTLLNAVSRSRAERIWAPVSLGIAMCCAVIAAQI